MARSMLNDPGLHSQTLRMEGRPYSPTSVVEVLFSAYGAGFWPPQAGREFSEEELAHMPGPILPPDIKITHTRPSRTWQVVIVPKADRYLLEAYGEDAKSPWKVVEEPWKPQSK